MVTTSWIMPDTDTCYWSENSPGVVKAPIRRNLKIASSCGVITEFLNNAWTAS